jgi:atypical dual specificity phosphatase
MPSYCSSTSSSKPHQDDLQVAQRKLQALSPIRVPRPLTAVCPRPIPNSYWATPLLLACEYPWTPHNPQRPKLDRLLRAGVRTFIDLTESGELIPYTSILEQRATLLGIDPSTIEYLQVRAIALRGMYESLLNLWIWIQARVFDVECQDG